jgi:hypothetical protein
VTNDNERSNDGRWRKGSSGNPGGRPAGSRNRATIALESMLEGEAERLTRKVLELALAGDTAALRMCMERLVPPRKDRTIQLVLPPIQTVQQVSQAMAAIVAAISEGQITPGEGEILAGILSQLCNFVLTADLEKRVEALEARETAEREKEAKWASRS